LLVFFRSHTILFVRRSSFRSFIHANLLRSALYSLLCIIILRSLFLLSSHTAVDREWVKFHEISQNELVSGGLNIQLCFGYLSLFFSSLPISLQFSSSFYFVSISLLLFSVFSSYKATRAL